MRRNLFHGTGLALLLVVAGVAQAADKNAGMASDQDYTALGQLKEITGTVMKVNATDKSFTVRLDMAQVNPKGVNNLVRDENRANQDQERILREEQDALRTLNPIQRAQKLQRLAADVQRLQNAQTQASRQTPTTTVHKDFDLESTTDAKVRRQNPPVQYDEKGNVKKYTAEELKELKGPDTKLPGYTADWTDLKDGQIVKITLSLPKKDKDNKDKDKDKTDTRVRASQVLIVKEPPENADQGKKK